MRAHWRSCDATLIYCQYCNDLFKFRYQLIQKVVLQRLNNATVTHSMINNRFNNTSIIGFSGEIEQHDISIMVQLAVYLRSNPAYMVVHNCFTCLLNKVVSAFDCMVFDNIKVFHIGLRIMNSWSIGRNDCINFDCIKLNISCVSYQRCLWNWYFYTSQKPLFGSICLPLPLNTQNAFIALTNGSETRPVSITQGCLIKDSECKTWRGGCFNRSYLPNLALAKSRLFVTYILSNNFYSAVRGLSQTVSRLHNWAGGSRPMMFCELWIESCIAPVPWFQNEINLHTAH